MIGSGLTAKSEARISIIIGFGIDFLGVENECDINTLTDAISNRIENPYLEYIAF